MLAVRDAGKDGQDHNIVAGIAAAHKTGSKHNHDNDHRVSQKAAFGSQLCHDVLDIAHQTGFLYAGHNRHKARNHDNILVNKAGKSILNRGNSGQHQQAARHQRRCAKREFVRHDHNDH